jgi:serine protease Do
MVARPVKKRRRGIRHWDVVLAAGFALCLYGGGSALADPPDTAGQAALPRGESRPASFADLVRREKPAVVNISTSQLLKDDKYHKDLFHGDKNPGPFSKGFKSQSLGSGFIISKDGLILTNHHVIEHAERIVVRLSDEREFVADVVGRDVKTDLALIQIHGNGDFPIVPLGSSGDLEVGDWVIAIGNPFGLEHTVTAGIVSAKGRVIGSGPYDDFIQTDASINPGNSGGPLFNVRGEVVGINAAINASGQGIGFAIPIDIVKGLLPQMRESGKVTRGWLGVMIQDVTEDLARSFGLSDREGALVADVTEGGPAAKGGIVRGDLITEFDGKKIVRMKDLPILVAGTPIGKEISIRLIRNGHEKNLSLQVAKLEDEADKVTKEDPPGRGDLGMDLEEIPDEAMDDGESPDRGAYVYRVDPAGPAFEAGIREGDVIQEVDRKTVRGLKDFRQLVHIKKTGQTLLILVNRGDEGKHYVTLKIP